MNLKLYTPRGSQTSPWTGFETLNNRLVRLFDDQPISRTVAQSAGRNTDWTPPVSVEETPDTFTLTAEAPGLTLEDLLVELENNVLTISGEKPAAPVSETEDSRLLLSERRYGSFRRTFTLPRRVDAEKIDARFNNGVLTVSLPKAAEAKPRTIAVKS